MIDQSTSDSWKYVSFKIVAGYGFYIVFYNVDLAVMLA